MKKREVSMERMRVACGNTERFHPKLAVTSTVDDAVNQPLTP